MSDLATERRDDEREEQQKAIDRESRGVVLCPNCGKETPAVIYCGFTECQFVGCLDCMENHGSFSWHCSPECAIKLLIHQILMGILSSGSKDIKTNIIFIQTNLAKINEIRANTPSSNSGRVSHGASAILKTE